MDKLYAAPMEGLTGYLWRQVHAELFGPADKYFTPFLSPNATCTFQRKELDEIDPEHNRGLNVVPQLLTNRAEHFLWAARELHDRGFREVNFNLGCPAGTVAAKRKGAGLLAYPQELDRCLEEIFAGLPRGMTVSVKTRIGKNDPGEWPGLLEIYRRYPLAELIVHPRLQKEFYKGTPHREAFSTVSGPWPVVYNGDIWTAEDAAALSRDFPGTDAVMLGRGLMRDPSLLRQLRGGPAASVREVRTYHDRLLDAQPLLHRQRHPHLRRRPAALGVRTAYGAPGPPGGHGPGQGHGSLQPALQVRGPHGGAHRAGPAHAAPPPAAGSAS